MKKKLFYSILLTVFVWAAMILTANAATYGNLTYSISNNEVTITDCSTYATSVAIPETIEGLPVTSIGSYAFLGCASLRSITIPDSVASIGSSAFYNCSSLTSIWWNARNVSDFSYGNYIFAYAGNCRGWNRGCVR